MILSDTSLIENMTRLITEALTSKKQIMKGLLGNIMWCCSNLARKKEGEMGLKTQQMQQVLYIVRTFMDCEEMVHSIHDALWTLSYLVTDSTDEFMTQVCQGKTTIQNLITFMKSDINEECTPAIRAIANILTSNIPENIDLFIFHGGLDAMNKVMNQNQQQCLMKECLWCLSNITAGTE
jgi:hypothetical protein